MNARSAVQDVNGKLLVVTTNRKDQLHSTALFFGWIMLGFPQYLLLVQCVI